MTVAQESKLGGMLSARLAMPVAVLLGISHLCMFVGFDTGE